MKYILAVLLLAFAGLVTATGEIIKLQAPTTREDGSQLPKEEIAGYEIHCQAGRLQSVRYCDDGISCKKYELSGPDNLSYTTSELTGPPWTCAAIVIDIFGLKSDFSNTRAVNISRPSPPLITIEVQITGMGVI